jgi:hypothetical protein
LVEERVGRVTVLKEAVEKRVKRVLHRRADRRLRPEGAVKRDKMVFRRDHNAKAAVLVGANAVGGLDAGPNPLVEGALLAA